MSIKRQRLCGSTLHCSLPKTEQRESSDASLPRHNQIPLPRTATPHYKRSTELLEPIPLLDRPSTQAPCSSKQLGQLLAPTRNTDMSCSLLDQYAECKLDPCKCLGDERWQKTKSPGFLAPVKALADESSPIPKISGPYTALTHMEFTISLRGVQAEYPDASVRSAPANDGRVRKRLKIRPQE